MEKINKENLDFINMLRSKTTLNGKPLRQLSEEDLVRQYEEQEKRKQAEKERKAKKQEALLGLIDGQVHKISESVPEYEFSESDFTYDYEYDVDTTYYEYKSYYVTVYPKGDKSNPKLYRFYCQGTAHSETVKWIGEKEWAPLDDEDCWEYTREAFEKGFEEMDICN